MPFRLWSEKEMIHFKGLEYIHSASQLDHASWLVAGLFESKIADSTVMCSSSEKQESLRSNQCGDDSYLVAVVVYIMVYLDIEVDLLVVVRHYISEYMAAEKIITFTLTEAVMLIFSACKVSSKAFYDEPLVTDMWVNFMRHLEDFKSTPSDQIKHDLNALEMLIFRSIEFKVIPSKEQLTKLFIDAQTLIRAKFANTYL